MKIRVLLPFALLAAVATPQQGEKSIPSKSPQADGAPMTREKDAAEMVFVPAGKFRMGLTRGELAAARGIYRHWGRDPDEEQLASETPSHEVELAAFRIDRLEVSNEQYGKFVEATLRAVPASTIGVEFNIWEAGTYPDHLARHPVVNVSWDDARAYCAWAGARLPTEAEWEKAARGMDGRFYPWGSYWDEGRSNRGRWDPKQEIWVGYTGDGHLSTAPVGSFPLGAGPYGTLDQAGNVTEWVWDRFGLSYDAVPPAEDSDEAREGDLRVTRGGSWYYTPVHMRTTHRDRSAADTANAHIGFRCARDAK